MNISGLKKQLTGHGGGFLFAVMVLQPPLDVLSYFMNGLCCCSPSLPTALLWKIPAGGI